MATYSDNFNAYASNYLAVVNSTVWEQIYLFNGILANGSGVVVGDGSYSCAVVKNSAVTFGLNVRVGITVKSISSGNYTGVFARCDASAGAGVGVYFSSDDGYLSKWTAGGQSEDVISYIGTGASADDLIEMEVIDDDIFVYKNSVLIHTSTGGATGYSSNQVGILWYGLGNTGDDFFANDVSEPVLAGNIVIYNPGDDGDIILYTNEYSAPTSTARYFIIG